MYDGVSLFSFRSFFSYSLGLLVIPISNSIPRYLVISSSSFSPKTLFVRLNMIIASPAVGQCRQSSKPLNLEHGSLRFVSLLVYLLLLLCEDTVGLLFLHDAPRTSGRDSVTQLDRDSLTTQRARKQSATAGDATVIVTAHSNDGSEPTARVEKQQYRDSRSYAWLRIR